MKKTTKNKNTGCETFYVNEKSVGVVRKAMKSEEVIKKLAETFKVLGDPTRTKIIFALSKKELCVCDLTILLGVSQSAVSHQLRILRNLDLVKYHKDGRSVFYSLKDDHIKTLFKQGLDHAEEKVASK